MRPRTDNEQQAFREGYAQALIDFRLTMKQCRKEVIEALEKCWNEAEYQQSQSGLKAVGK